jgi:hypothetical protein
LIWLLFISLLVSSACGQQDRGELRNELRTQSATNGLAFAEAHAGHVTVIPFDGPERYFESGYRFPITAFGKAGQMVLWWYRSNFYDIGGEYIIESTGGQNAARNRPKIAGFHPIGISETGGRIAFWAQPRAGLPTGLYWAPFDFSTATLVDNTSEGADWSPDGRSLVYGKEGQIYIFDVASGASKPLVAGGDPTWSPNGKWIAFVGLAGRASAVTTVGAPVEWPLSSHKPLSAMRWSPDGHYVSFAVETASPPLTLLDVACTLVVCRVSDGQTTIVQEFGPESGNYAGFYWIVDYRKFCGRRTPSP